MARQTLAEPRTVENFEIEIAKKKFGPKFRKDAGTVEKWLTSRTQCELEELGKELSEKGKIVAQIKGVEGDVELDGDLIKIDKVKRTEHVREFVPNVIEPSFGIGRIYIPSLNTNFGVDQMMLIECIVTSTNCGPY